jgi:AcrR family transcriptional regulator
VVGSEHLVDERKSKRQAQAAATQEQLLRAARGVFAARGYQATTVGAITEAASTAHGTFYLYFKNKEDVFGRILEQLAKEVAERSSIGAEQLSVERALRQTVGETLDLIVRHGGIFRCVVEGALSTPAIGVVWLQTRRHLVDGLAELLESLQVAGHVRALDTQLTAHALTAMLEWTAFTHFLFGPSVVPELTVERVADNLADLWYRAIVAEVPAGH